MMGSSHGTSYKPLATPTRSREGYTCMQMISAYVRYTTLYCTATFNRPGRSPNRFKLARLSS